MGADSKIEWTDHSWNPWTGCQAVSPACDHCYAEAQARRAPKTFGGWGPHAERRRTSAAYWRAPLRWNRQAEKEGRRARVFTASMGDIMDNQVPIAWLVDALDVMRVTTNLIWLLLTKRPELILRRLREAMDAAYAEGRMDLGHWLNVWLTSSIVPSNIWLGTTAEDRARLASRAWHLAQVPAHRRFLSCEPLLEGLNTRRVTNRWGTEWDALTGRILHGRGGPSSVGAIHWVIAGGESGAHARPSHPDWFAALRDQCITADTAFFFKQIGEWDVASVKNGYCWGNNMKDGPAVWVGIDGRTAKPSHHGLLDPIAMWRRGKKASGALLDGREWKEFPDE